MTVPVSMQGSHGAYEVVRALGDGEYTEVFLARSPAHVELALKRVRAPHLSDATWGQRLLAEAHLGAALRHRNLVTTLDVGRHQGQPFFVMELVRGPQLPRLVQHAARVAGRLPLAEALAIVIGVAAALEHAHQLRTRGGVPLGVVHLDVCPKNVLISTTGEVKLINFSGAKTEPNAFSRLLAEGRLSGPIPERVGTESRRTTPAYMSPEHCTGAAIDHRSDIFSLGVVLWELTAGRRLHRTGDADAVMEAVVHQDAPSPRSSDRQYPAGLEPIVLRALERDPSRRFSSAHAFGAALEDFAFANGLHASATGLAQRVRTMFSTGSLHKRVVARRSRTA